MNESSDEHNVFHNSFLSQLKWVLFVSRRFSRVDRKGRSAVTSFLASLGICFGVMTLITVISVMNGFQMGFIDAIMEVSSYHVRASVPADDAVSFARWCEEDRSIVSAVPFYEAQSLIVGGSEGWQKPAVIRAVPQNTLDLDAGFKRELKMWTGSFDLSKPHSIVMGTELARMLGVRVGSIVNLFALSGGGDVDLISSDRLFTVTGLFRTGYSDINSSYAFISIEDGQNCFGANAQLMYGIKLRSTAEDAAVISKINNSFSSVKTESWKSYNRAFFGALRVEKNMLMMLVFLIFIVVGINIFNGMRRLVYERREEISVFSALGARSNVIQSIFIMRGFLTGFAGALPGLALGLMLSVRIENVFTIMSKLVYYVQLFGEMLISPSTAAYVRENPMYMLYAHIPARIIPAEVLAITIFGIFSSLVASWAASRGVLKMTVAEVLRDE